VNRHPRAKRLKVIVDLAEKAEQQALSEWGQLQQKLVQEQQQQQQLEDYAAEYQRSLSTPSAQGMTGGAIQNALGFIGQIKQALTQQQQQLTLIEKQVDSAQQAYLEQHGKVKALHHLLEKLDHEYDQEQDKQAQRLADEWANRAAFHNTGKQK